MSNVTPGPNPPLTTKRRLRCESAASLALLTAAAVTLAALAFFSAPVSSSDAQDLPPSIDATSAMNRVPDDFARPAGSMFASVIAPPAASFAYRSAAPSSYAVDANGARVPLFFGFVEFDWDPDAPGGVPGFGPLAR